MMARALVTLVIAPLPSLKSRLLRTMLHIVLIVMVTMLSLFIGTILSAILLGGVEL